MKITNNSFLLRFSLSLAMLLGVFAGLKAENKIFVEPFTLDSYDTYMMPVQLDLDEDYGVNSVQFDVKLPEQLEFAGTNITRNLDRVSQSGFILNFNQTTGRVLLTGLLTATIKGLDGPILYVPVKARENALNSNSTVTLSLDLTDGGMCRNKPGTVTVEDLPLVSEPTQVQLFSLKIWSYTPQADFVVNPGATINLEVAINNSGEFRDFTTYVKVPEGFELGTPELSSRCDPNTQIIVSPNNLGSYTLAAVNFNGVPTISGNDGVAFTLPVTVPADFSAEKAVITMSDWIYSAGNGTKPVSITPPADKAVVTFTLVNGADALNQALEEVKALQTALENALTEIQTSCPDVKDNFTGTEISSKISALETAINEAYENGTLTGNYNQVMAPVAGISSDIADLVAAAKEAQKTFEDEGAAAAARQIAYDKAMAEVKTLEDALAAALETIATDCPDVKDNFKGEAIAQQIADMKAAIDAAMQDKTIIEKYDSLVAPAAAITAATEKLVADAQAAQAAFAAEKALTEARANADAKVKELQDALAAAIAQIAEECPAVKDNFKGESIRQDINELKTDILAAFVDKTLANDYETVVTEPATAIEAAIAKLIEDAKAAQKEVDDEAARVAANKEAYETVVNTLNDLQAVLDEMKQQLEKQYPDVDMTEEIAAVETAIADARAKAEADYQAVAAEGLFNAEAFAETVETINNDITKLPMIAAEKKAEADEAARQAANKEAYETVVNTLNDLQTVLDETKLQLEKQYPAIDMTEEIAAVETAIADARAKAEADYEAVAEEGVFNAESFRETVETINNDITKLPMIAAERQAVIDEEARQAANKEAYETVINTLNDLQEVFDETKLQLEAQYPDVDMTEEIAAIETAIADARAKAEADYEAVAEEGNFDVEPFIAIVENINNDITKLPMIAAEKKAAADEEARQAANKEAYETVISTLNDLQTVLDETKLQLEAQYPDVDMTEEIAAVETAIADARAKAEADYEAVAEEGNFDVEPFIAIVENINNDITKLPMIAAEKKAAADEEARQAANKEAYETVISTLNDLQTVLDETKLQLEAQYPDVDMTEEIAAIETAIADARAKAEADYEAVAEEGNFDVEPFIAIVENINNDITNLTAIAAEKKAAADEEARQAANQAAYDATLAEIAELQAELDAMTIKVAENYPDVDVNAEIKIAQDAIDALTAGAEAAFEAVAEEGTYEYTVDADSVKKLINDIEDRAQALGIEDITADMLGKDVKIYNLQGVRVNTPTTDAIHVIVSNDGTVRKVVIK